MDNLLEILIPLILAAFYFFGNVFSGKKEDRSKPTPGRGRSGVDEEDDVMERQRRIQEEIRRKIMERRQAQGGTPAEPVEVPVPVPPESPSRRPEPMPSAPGPVPQAPNPYESQMQARLRQIEATKLRAEKLKQQAEKAGAPALPEASSIEYRHPEAISKSGPRFRGSVKAGLSDPATLRAAFVYAEVLGRPVSQRKSNPVPGLS